MAAGFRSALAGVWARLRGYTSTVVTYPQGHHRAKITLTALETAQIEVDSLYTSKITLEPLGTVMDPKRPYVGQQVRLRARFYNDGVLTDPATITLKLKNGNGTLTFSLAGMTNLAVGDYCVDHTCLTGEGSSTWYVTSTGIDATSVSLDEDTGFIVQELPF